MVRFAEKTELARINELRAQVNKIHVVGRPEFFKPGFGADLQAHLYTFWQEAAHYVIVAQREGALCGYAMARDVVREENAFRRAERFYEIEEFGVDPAHQRQGVATELFDFIKADAASRGFARIDLNMWEFNETALAFYEAMGMKSYRRYMELKL